MRFLFALALLVLPLWAYGNSVEIYLQRARASELWKHPEWHRILHYQKGIFGGISSESSVPEFFLASDGRDNPQLELEAMIRGLFLPASANREDEIAEIQKKKGEPSPKLQHPQCQFPLRARWVREKLNIPQNEVPVVQCRNYGIYRKVMDAASITLVFSSYFLNNPSSTFGHSFLRVNRKGPPEEEKTRHSSERFELLDHGANYGAQATTGNPILYAILGLFGGFSGSFQFLPYFYKVREYNDFESRDLWSYDLNLSIEEVDRVMEHLWELGSTYFPYYYLTKNCSYHVLAALEAAVPRLELVNRLPFWVIPSDTIKAVYESPGLVKEITYRPSARSTFLHRLPTLAPGERDAFEHVSFDEPVESALENLSQRQDLSKEQKAKVLDAAMEYHEYHYPDDLLKDAAKQGQVTPSLARKQKLLRARAMLGIPSPDADRTPPQGQEPHLGHGSRRATFGGGADRSAGGSGFGRVAMRFALHDVLDRGIGYPKAAQIEFAHLKARVNAGDVYEHGGRKRFEVEDLTLFRVMSLGPVTRFDHSPSWRAQVGSGLLRQSLCRRCWAGFADGGYGKAVGIGGDENPIIIYGMMDAGLTGSPGFEASPVAVWSGPHLGALLAPTQFLRVMLESRYAFQLFASRPVAWFSRANARFVLSKSLAVDLTADFNRRSSESKNFNVFGPAGELDHEYSAGLMVYW